MNTVTTAVKFGYRESKKTGYKRPDVHLQVSLPSAVGIVEALSGEDEKVKALILDAVQSVVTSHLRSFVDDDPDFSQETCDALEASGELALEHIANIPRADRNVTSKEDLESLTSDYIEVMPEITGKDLARVTAAANIIVERFKPVAGNQKMLEILKDQLGVFIENAPEDVIARHSRTLTWAVNKLDSLLQAQVAVDAL